MLPSPLQDPPTTRSGRRRRRRGRRRPSLATLTPQGPRSRSRYQDGLTFLDGFLGRGSACSAACCCFRGFSSFICRKEGGKEKAPAKSGGGRRRKWSKGKQKEKVNTVLFDQATTYDKLLSEVTVRVVLHGSRAAAVRGMPQCMVNEHFVQNLFCKTELCAELWKEEKIKEWHIRATSKQARLEAAIKTREWSNIAQNGRCSYSMLR
ncbi:uncharacterized protein LOC120674789 [Panicum virgatum]|uniref:uncharacterized protein LOC120674789 n=1 Tax=Panicum virgatum TaxID=38727 RepID=UPI0019D515E8|nr:uncharacterized protein LOC120674789 [Panicum virgatum]